MNIELAADGECTSYSAPLVTGTAGLLKAVDDTISPQDMIATMKDTGKLLPEGAHFLDTTAAVLKTILNQDSNYVPMSLNQTEYSYEHADDSVSVTETGHWKIDDETLSVIRDGTETPPSGMTSDSGFASKSRLTASQQFELGLIMTTDAEARTVPAMTVLPKDEQDYELEGDNETPATTADGEDIAEGYCFHANYDLNDKAPDTSSGDLSMS